MQSIGFDLIYHRFLQAYFPRNAYVFAPVLEVVTGTEVLAVTSARRALRPGVTCPLLHITVNGRASLCAGVSAGTFEPTLLTDKLAVRSRVWTSSRDALTAFHIEILSLSCVHHFEIHALACLSSPTSWMY